MAASGRCRHHFRMPHASRKISRKSLRFERSATGCGRCARSCEARESRSQASGRVHHGQRCLSAGLGQNPARQAAIFGGLAPETGAMTINKVCGSGLKAVALAAQAIQTGNSSIVVAGGMESMTNAPYLLPQARKGYRLGNRPSSIPWCTTACGIFTTTTTWESPARTSRRSTASRREEQDEFALNSHRKALAAHERVPLQIADRSSWNCPQRKRAQPDRDLRERRRATRRHNDRSPALAQARVQEGRHRHGRQRSRSQRWRGRGRYHECAACPCIGRETDGPHRGPGDQRQ